MATSKTLKPTNQTISIPAMSDRPNQSVNSDCISKEADAINVLSDGKTGRTVTSWGRSVQATIQGSSGLFAINSNVLGIVWIPATNDIAVFVISQDGVFRKTGSDGSVTFGTTSTGTNYTITRDGNAITLTAAGDSTLKIYA